MWTHFVLLGPVGLHSVLDVLLADCPMIALSIIVILIALSVQAKAGRHSAAYTLGNYDTSFSGA